MLRPVVYLYETARSVTEAVPVNPPPPYEEVNVVYDVHAIGNPILWWASSVAILAEPSLATAGGDHDSRHLGNCLYSCQLWR